MQTRVVTALLHSLGLIKCFTATKRDGEASKYWLSHVFLFFFLFFPIPTERNEALGIGLLLPEVRMEGVSCLQQEQNWDTD